MDTSKLSEGIVVKNYKEMCNLLGEDITDGNSKKAQLKKWERYFDYGRKGQKIIVEKIYDVPFPESANENSIYVKTIEMLLMYELGGKEGYCCNYTKTNLFKLLGMINRNYIENKKFIKSEELKKYNKWEIDHFYGRTAQKLSNVLFSALNSMKKRCLIEYEEQNIIIEFVDGKEIHRVATPSETSCILQAKTQVLSMMGYSKVPFVRANEFYDKVNKKLNEVYGWDRIYKEYRIIYNKEYMNPNIDVIQKEIQEEIRSKKIKLNFDIIKAIKKQARKLYEKNYNDFMLSCDKSLENEGETPSNNKDKFLYPSTYIDNQDEFTEFFLHI